MEFFSTLLLSYGIDALSLAVGGGVASVLGPVGKILLLKCCPKAAPLFSMFSQGQKELLKIINAADKTLNKNEDLERWAKDCGFKVAAQLIKKIDKCG